MLRLNGEAFARSAGKRSPRRIARDLVSAWETKPCLIMSRWATFCDVTTARRIVSVRFNPAPYDSPGSKGITPRRRASI